jgi:hypothetical protein
MKKIQLLLSIVLIAISCQKKQSDQKEIIEKSTTENVQTKSKLTSNEVENAKKWLIETIDVYFKKDNLEMTGITTKTYEDYKVDAINVDLDTDGALTQEAFDDKWKSKFDTKYAGIGVGFLISAEDFGKIKVTKCDLLLSQSSDGYIFKTVITDTEFKTNYKRDIKIIKSGNSFLIDDVREYH